MGRFYLARLLASALYWTYYRAHLRTRNKPRAKIYIFAKRKKALQQQHTASSHCSIVNERGWGIYCSVGRLLHLTHFLVRPLDTASGKA